MPLQLSRYFIAFCMLLFALNGNAQKVYYPARSSDLLKSTAQDVADIFNRSIQNSHITTEEYGTSIPLSGIIFIYDSSITNNQSCKIICTGTGNIKFSASQDNGLCFGVYTYLKKLGFRFYLPGSIWEKIPVLSSPYNNINEVVTGTFKYNNWFISGGCGRWAMDNDNSFGWESYSGKNGHEWAKYQRRNNMNGSYRFNGHRGDIINAEYISALQSHPCYVACYNGQRMAGYQSAPDINNYDAKLLWSNTIQQKYSAYKNLIIANQGVYSNYYRNFGYYNDLIGIEVADGATWGNSTDNSGCAAGNYNGKPYPKESDQHFLLANFTAERINFSYPEKQFQCYAYAGHADLPSAAININSNIHVQVVASAFQSETSTKGLLNRWYKKSTGVSEYGYANIPQWTGETPMFSLSEYKNTLQRIKLKNGEGLVLEASPAKFATLPFLFAGNRFVLDNANIDSSIGEFTDNMFPAEVSIHIRQLLKYWGDDNIFTVGYYIKDNKYKIPLYLQELNKAIVSLNEQNAEVTARLQELKAYLHYMVLYYDFINDKRSYLNKSAKATALCLYLAKVSKMQLVNSYFLIQDIVNKYPADNPVNAALNVTNGSIYLSGTLSLITNEEINNDFLNDLSRYGTTVTDYKFENGADIISKLNTAGLKTLSKINVKIGYTNGWDYPQRSEFYLYAAAPGSFTINCNPHFNMVDKGFINFVVEAADKPLSVISDITVSAENNPGVIKINISEAGFYKLTYVSKYQTSSDISIITNGNLFFRKGPFYGEKFENYWYDWESLPKYFYVPQGVNKLYFGINNSCSSNCESALEIQNSFLIRDNNRKPATIQVAPGDSSLFSIEVPLGNAGKFWEVSRMNQYNLCFANITNMEIYAERKPLAAPIPDTQGGINVYPNPSGGVFNFTNQTTPVLFENIDIYDAQGKMIRHFTNTSTVDIAAMPAGVYLFSATNKNENKKGKLIKN